MFSIIIYIMKMLPYMIVSIPIYLLIRFNYIKRNKKFINLYHEFALAMLSVFTVGLLSQTIIPKYIFEDGKIVIIKSGFHETNLIPFKVIIETYFETFVNNNINYFLINFLGNIIMFIPFGFIIPLLWNISNKKVIIIGFSISLFIEVCQLFLIRGTDIDDLMLNTLGVVVGLLIYKSLTKKCYNMFNKYKY